MNTRMLMLVIGLVTCAAVLLACSNQLRNDTPESQLSPEHPSGRYRMFRTENVWTNLLLDTRTGKVWQVSITVDKDGQSIKLPINAEPLVEPRSTRDGRFSLYTTGNMWNWILLDQEDGRVWQCQFSLKSSEERFLARIDETKQK
jgi:hypothetical protein